MSIIAKKQKFTLEIGATWHKRVKCTAGGQPADLTGRFARMEIRKKPNAPLLCEVLCLIDPDQSLSSPNRGIIDLWIHVDQTLLVPYSPVPYQYDLELVLPNAYTVNGQSEDDVIRLLKGQFITDNNVTLP